MRRAEELATDLSVAMAAEPEGADRNLITQALPYAFNIAMLLRATTPEFKALIMGAKAPPPIPGASA
jgi:hypothetical protein